MALRSNFVRRALRGCAMGCATRIASWLTVGVCATCTGTALAQTPAGAGGPSAQLTVLSNLPPAPLQAAPSPAPLSPVPLSPPPLVPVPLSTVLSPTPLSPTPLVPAPLAPALLAPVPPSMGLLPPAPTLSDPSLAFGTPVQFSYQAAISGQTQTSGDSSAAIDFFGLGAPSVLPWSANQPSDVQDFVRLRAGANYKTRVQASSSIAESHAPGHHRQKEQAARKAAASEFMRSSPNVFSPNAPTTNEPPPAPGAATVGAFQASLQTGADSQTKQTPYPFDLFSGLTFETSYGARAAVNEDTTRMATAPNGGFLPSAIPVENQPYFGGPARTSVNGSSSSVGLQLNDSPTPELSVTAYANVVAVNADPTTTGSPGVGIQQAFLQINNFVVGQMETAFADNDALPPTLDPAGPNARVSIEDTSATMMGQGRLSYFLHQMPTTAGDGYAINLSVEQPIPEIITPTTPKPFTTFARFPDMIGTVKVGEMLEAPTDKSGDSTKTYYEAWHIQLGGLVRSLGLEESNDSIDESAFGWGVSLSGHYTFNFPDSCTILPDAIYGSVTYGVGIAHYIDDLHSQSPTTVGNDAVLDGTYLRPLGDLAYYAGYLHNWADHWRSLVCYSHVTLESQGQGLKTFGTLYRFGDYASANIEWHRLVNGAGATGAGSSTTYDFNLGLEYIYGRFEELSGAAGQDQRISLVAAISK
jgi:hypothetical protein